MAGSGVAVGNIIGVVLGAVGVALFVDFGKAKIKLMPLIIPRIYMSRASLREGVFERVGVGFGVMVWFSGIFLLLRRCMALSSIFC